jgi:hypothetical protein
MENTFVVKDEPITIRITIEVMPTKKAEPEKVLEVPKAHELDVASGVQQDLNKKVSNETLVLTPPIEPIAAPPKKERKPRAAKVKPVDEKVVETFVTPKVTPPIVSTNKPVARAAQMIKFFCKASGINASDITVSLLKEKGAFDIIENLSEADAALAIKEAAK